MVPVLSDTRRNSDEWLQESLANDWLLAVSRVKSRCQPFDPRMDEAKDLTSLFSEVGILTFYQSDFLTSLYRKKILNKKYA